MTCEECLKQMSVREDMMWACLALALTIVIVGIARIFWRSKRKGNTK